MAIVSTRIVIKCKNRKEYKQVGVHIGSCKKHFDGCKDHQSFDYIANPLLLTYSGSFHDQVFEGWNAEHPILTANVAHVIDDGSNALGKIRGGPA